MTTSQNTENIIVVGWGSMLWEARAIRNKFCELANLPCTCQPLNQQQWHTKGPQLPLEFSRHDETRKIFELVVDHELGTPTYTSWTQTSNASLLQTVLESIKIIECKNPKEREGFDLGFVTMNNNSGKITFGQSKGNTQTVQIIQQWVEGLLKGSLTSTLSVLDDETKESLPSCVGVIWIDSKPTITPKFLSAEDKPTQEVQQKLVDYILHYIQQESGQSSDSHDKMYHHRSALTRVIHAVDVDTPVRRAVEGLYLAETKYKPNDNVVKEKPSKSHVIRGRVYRYFKKLHPKEHEVLEWIANHTHIGKNGYTEYVEGTIPVVMTAPHGGIYHPDEIPNRTRGVLDGDINTVALTCALAASLYSLPPTVAKTKPSTPALPHIIINNLSRPKLDANRNIEEAAQGNIYAEYAWFDFHCFTEIAKRRAGQTNSTKPANSNTGRVPGVHYFDIHGQSVTNKIMVGHFIRKSDFDGCCSDSSCGYNSLVSKLANSSLRSLASFYPDETSKLDLIVGANSLSHLIIEIAKEEEASITSASPKQILQSVENDTESSLLVNPEQTNSCCAPSRAEDSGVIIDCTPVGKYPFDWGCNSFYHGGYNTYRHGSLVTNTPFNINGTQLETSFVIRKNGNARRVFGSVFAKAVHKFFIVHYGIDLASYTQQ